LIAYLRRFGPTSLDRKLVGIAAAALLLPAATAAGAQVSTNARVSNLAANAAIGAVLAAARSVLGGRRLTRPVLLGAVGGALQGVGRQVAAGRSTASGLVGREISALGISLTYSAGADSLVLIAPIWLITLEVRPNVADRVRARVSLADLALVASALVDGRSDFELGSSLSAGAPVFSRPLRDATPGYGVPAGFVQAGYSRMGVIYLVNGIPPVLRREALSHESVHLLQWDAYNQLVAFPIERAIVRRLPGGRSLSRFVDLGVLGPGAAFLIAHQIPYERQPWEREAYLLTTGRPTPGPGPE
jgi:hypothetical protein